MTKQYTIEEIEKMLKENDSTFFTAAPEIIRFLLDELKEKDRLLEVAQKMYRDSQEAFNVAAKILNQIK